MLCARQCVGAGREVNKNATRPLSLGRAQPGRGSRYRLVNKSLHMQCGKLADTIKRPNAGCCRGRRRRTGARAPAEARTRGGEEGPRFRRRPSPRPLHPPALPAGGSNAGLQKTQRLSFFIILFPPWTIKIFFFCHTH